MNSENKGSPRSTFFLLSVLLLSGFALRLFLSRYLTFEFDFNTFRAWGNGISKVGFSEFYDRYWCDYMPGYLYVLWLLDNIHSAFPKLQVKILYKLPANLSDLGISVLIFFTLRRITNLKYASLASLAYFFNPASLANSTFWGQVDSVHALPLLLSVLLGLWGHLIPSAIFAGIAFMIKPQSVVILPILGIFVIRYVVERIKEGTSTLRASVIVLGVFAALFMTVFVISMPYVWDKLNGDNLIGIFREPIILIKERFSTAYDQYKYASLNAFNFWGMFAMWKSDQIRFLGITYQTWGTIIFGFFYAIIFCFLFSFELLKRKELRNLETIGKQSPSGSTDDTGLTIHTSSAVMLILFALFLFVTRVHERHFLPTVVFFSLIAFRSYIYWLFYTLISATYVINLLYAYIKYYPIKFFRPSLLEPYVSAMVLLLLIIFLLVLVDFIRNSFLVYKRKETVS
jgi:Gpi18-like mannosyltransferase